MTNQQLYLAVGVPIVFNTLVTSVLVGFMWAHFNARIDALERAFNTRFDDLKDMWRTELRRVEEVWDARLKHMEEKLEGRA